MADIEPHIKATIDKIPDAELRPLLAGILQRLVACDGAAFACLQFPAVARCWQDPGTFYPKPWETAK